MIIKYNNFNFTMEDYNELLSTLSDTNHLTVESIEVLKRLHVAINGPFSPDLSFGQIGYAYDNDILYELHSERDLALCALCKYCCDRGGKCDGHERRDAASERRQMNPFAMWYCASSLMRHCYELYDDNYLKQLVQGGNISEKYMIQLF